MSAGVKFPASEWFTCLRAADEIGDLADRVDHFVDIVLAFTRPDAPEPAPVEQIAVAA